MPAPAIFGDVDPRKRPRVQFGDGKPFFVPGRMMPCRCASIVGILEDRCGKGGFDYLVGVPGSMLIGGGEQMGWEDSGDEDLDDEGFADMENDDSDE
jgi:hypothetical protein